jgi:phosphatidylglycerophosphate synthase
MTLATGFTLLRGVMVGPIMAAVLLGYSRVALALFAVAAATDVADGLIARSRHEVTTLGALLDPVVDKVLYGGLFFSLAGAGKLPYLGPILYAIPQLGLGVGTLLLWRRRRRLMARWPGKAAAALTALAALALIATPWGEPAFWTAVGANFLAAGAYLHGQLTQRARPEGGK